MIRCEKRVLSSVAQAVVVDEWKSRQFRHQPWCTCLLISRYSYSLLSLCLDDSFTPTFTTMLTRFVLLLSLISIAYGSLGTKCSEWNTVYGKQWWASEASQCRLTQSGNATNLLGAGTEYCCRLYARLNAAFMYFISPKPDGLACGVTDSEQSTVYAKLYYRNCKDFAAKAPMLCPVCNGNGNGNATAPSIAPAASASPSPEPANLINPVPIMPGATGGNETTAGNGTTTTTNGDDDTTTNTTTGGGTNDGGNNTGTTGGNAGDGNIEEVSVSDGTGNNAGGANASASESGSICLHGSLRVTLTNGRTIRVDALKTGDSVLESGDIYMFSHNSRERATFVNLTTASGRWLAATPGHLIHTSNGLKSAGTIGVGEVLDGGHRIVRVWRFKDVGVYNPHTIRGDIIVNGLRASTYTTHVPAKAAHGALSFMRMVWRALRLHTTLLHCGVPSWNFVMGGACIA